jgi:hypothetical protein
MKSTRMGDEVDAVGEGVSRGEDIVGVVGRYRAPGRRFASTTRASTSSRSDDPESVVGGRR